MSEPSSLILAQSGRWGSTKPDIVEIVLGEAGVGFEVHDGSISNSQALIMEAKLMFWVSACCQSISFYQRET